MNSWFLYLLLKLDVIQGCFFMVGSILIILTIIFLVIIAVEAEDDDIDKLCSAVFNIKHCRYGILGIFIIMLGAFTPSSKQMAIIYVVPKVINSEIVQQIPKKLLQLSNEWLEELSPEQKDDK